METTYYTGIDQHKRSSYLTTVDAEGDIVRSKKLKNNPDAIRAYFRMLAGEHAVTVESTTGWYWMNDLLSAEGIDLSLAHATFVKAISYAKVKTDKFDAETLAQLLRVGLIPEAHKVSRELRDIRDMPRTRLSLVEKRTSAKNSIHRVLEKFNLSSPEDLPELFRLQRETSTIGSLKERNSSEKSSTRGRAGQAPTHNWDARLVCLDWEDLRWCRGRIWDGSDGAVTHHES